LEMKLAAPEFSHRQKLHQRVPAWTHRALAAAERVRLHEFVRRLNRRDAVRHKIT
jgi:hypothetical protein